MPNSIENSLDQARQLTDEVRKAAASHTLTAQQIKDLLESGGEPEYRSLAGILEDAARLGAMAMHDVLAKRLQVPIPRLPEFDDAPTGQRRPKP